MDVNGIVRGSEVDVASFLDDVSIQEELSKAKGIPSFNNNVEAEVNGINNSLLNEMFIPEELSKDSLNAVISEKNSTNPFIGEVNSIEELGENFYGNTIRIEKEDETKRTIVMRTMKIDEISNQEETFKDNKKSKLTEDRQNRIDLFKELFDGMPSPTLEKGREPIIQQQKFHSLKSKFPMFPGI